MTLPDNFHQLFESVPARHKEVSMILSADDERATPTKRLLDISMKAGASIWGTKMPIFEGRRSTETRWFEVWPGEHYRLLNALVQTLKPKKVIEVGTFTGMGTLSLLQSLPAGGSITTFDLIAWDAFDQTWLAQSDFFNGRVTQILDDVSAPNGVERHRTLFESADLIFVDGPKDGFTEAKILANFETLKLDPNVLVVFDDIRVMNMVDVWRRIQRPKLDISSFGHWSGTGLIDWNTAKAKRRFF